MNIFLFHTPVKILFAGDYHGEFSAVRRAIV